VEDEAVRARLDVGEVADASVVVGLPVRDELIAAEELDEDACGRDASPGVEITALSSSYCRSRRRRSNGNPNQNHVKAPPRMVAATTVQGSPKRKSVIR
jgi:hypothetical protein